MTKRTMMRARRERRFVVAVHRSIIYSVICFPFSFIALAKIANQKKFDRLSCSILYCRHVFMYLCMYVLSYLFFPRVIDTK